MEKGARLTSHELAIQSLSIPRAISALPFSATPTLAWALVAEVVFVVESR